MHDPEHERFRELYRRHRHAVTAYVRRRAPGPVVEDIVADTFLVCWRRRDQVPAEALPWLYAVASRTLANDRRKRSHAEAAATASALANLTEMKPAGDPLLASAFADLSQSDREVLSLVAWEDLTIHEAATVLGCSPVACRVRLHRARRRLAARLFRIEAHETSTAPLSEGATQ